MFDLRRRAFITLLGGAAAWPLAARAQTAGRRPIVAFVRSLARWAPALVRSAPSGLEALSDVLHQERLVGLVSLLLLVPAGLGLRRAFARARGRR